MILLICALFLIAGTLYLLWRGGSHDPARRDDTEDDDL
jgi:hypothetical protein